MTQPAIDLAEATRRFDLGKIVQQYDTRAVTDYGIECLTDYYPIERTV